jgi:hypothetical protein
LFTRRTIVQILFVNIEELAIQNKSRSNGAEVIQEKSTDWTHIRPSAATLRKADGEQQMYRRKMRHEERGYLRIRTLLLKCMSIEPYSRYISRAAAGPRRESAKRSHPQSNVIAAADGLTVHSRDERRLVRGLITIHLSYMSPRTKKICDQQGQRHRRPDYNPANQSFKTKLVLLTQCSTYQGADHHTVAKLNVATE